MASVFALVSKGEFERQHAKAREGDVLPFTVYTSGNKALEPLAQGGDLYLVTVRPGDVLWLVAVLRSPRKDPGAWKSTANAVPVVDAGPLLSQLRFASGKGISVEPGKLGMSLQTPRALTDADVALLEALTGGSPPTTASATTATTTTTTATTTTAAKARSTSPAISTATASGAPVGTPWATPPARPEAVPAEAYYDAIDDRWVLGTRSPDGCRHGPWKEWRADGSLYLDTHYVDGLIHGIQRELHPDGSPAGEARWIRGVQKDSVKLRAKSGATDAFWSTAAPRIVRIDSIPDENGRGWRTGILRDASGVEVTPAGEPVPPRPTGVPETARLYVAEGPPAWVDTTSQYTTLAPVGHKRVWSAAGELLRESEYTPHGRLIWHREVLDPDPRTALVDAFFADPVEFSPMYELGQHWTLDRHSEVRARLRDASTRHVAGYLELIAERIEWHLKPLAPCGLTACGFEITDDWLARGPAVRRDDGAADILRWLLAKRLERHEKAAVSELLPLARAVFEKDNEIDLDLLRDGDALVKGTTDRELDKLASSRSAWSTDDLLRLARRALQRSGLSVYLGDPTEGAVLLLDETHQAFLFDGQTFAPAPVVVETSERDNAVQFQSVDTCDERRLFISGEHVWWSLTRFGWMVHVQGSRYFSDRGQAEVILSGLVRCPDRAWVDRVIAMFRAMLPSKAVEVDPFFDAKKGYLFARQYGATKKESHGYALSRAVDGATILKCTGSPGVLRLEMREKKAGAVPKPVSQHATAEEARERFSRFELELFRDGYHLDRIVALPVGVKTPEKTAPEKPPAPEKPKPPVTLDVAERVGAELRRAASAKGLSARLAALRDAWQRRPAIALAIALDTLAAGVPPRPDLAGKTKAAVARWDELAAKPDAAALGPLLASLTDVASTVVQPRLEQLATWPADPRLDQKLVAIATEVPFTSSGTQSVWRRVFARIAASTDARILAPLRALPGIYKTKWKTVTGAWAIEQVEKILAARADTLEALGALALHAEDQALLETLLAGASTPVASTTDGTDALIQAVFAAPDDASRRLAYAAKHKDVRAEHITLSAQGDALDKTGRARLAELERDHVAELAGPLAKWLKKGARFRSGFLVRAAKTGNELSPELAASPWWSTVEDLDVGFDHTLVCSPALVSLRTLRGIHVDEDPAEGEEAPVHITVSQLPVRPLVTSFALGVHTSGVIGALLRAGTFPAITELEVALPRRLVADVSWLDEPAARTLARVEIVQDLDSTRTYLEPHGPREEHDRTSVTWLAELWGKATRDCPSLVEIAGTFTYGVNVTFLLSRDERGEGELSVRCGSRLHGWGKVLADNLAFLLDALGPSDVRHARLDLDRTDRDLVTAIDESARLAQINVEWRARGK